MQYKGIITLVGIVILLIPFIVRKKVQEYRLKQISELLYKKQYDEVLILLSQFSTRMVLLPYNREYIKLNIYFLQKDRNRVINQIDYIDKSVMKNKKQRIEFYNKAFSFFVSEKDEEKCLYYLNKLNKLTNSKGDSEYDIIYSIQIKKDDKYLDLLLERIKQCDSQLDKNKIIYYKSLLLQVYENKNDKANIDILSKELKALLEE
ncbi:MAG: hypothetical protein KBT35_00770 [Firmicutes bacterium]|nr:hypothetical protein [Candidatus Colivicinus equi]